MTPARTHDGRVFPSLSAASRALGVDVSTFLYHIDRYGHTARIGAPGGTSPSAVDLDGVTYPSIAAASKATGMSRSAINWRRGYRKPKRAN